MIHERRRAAAPGMIVLFLRMLDAGSGRGKRSRRRQNPTPSTTPPRLRTT